jgi:ketosteroid isomerase-like protein
MNKPTLSQLFKTFHYVFAALFLLSMTSCNSGTKNTRSELSDADLIAAAEELDSLFLVAFNTGDADAMMKLYWNSPDLRAYFPTEMQLSGYDAVKESMIRDFSSSKGAKLEYTNANNIPFTNGVVGHGTFRITMPSEGSEPMVFDGRYTEVKVMKDGKMVITVDHASVPMSPPPADSTQTK